MKIGYAVRVAFIMVCLSWAAAASQAAVIGFEGTGNSNDAFGSEIKGTVFFGATGFYATSLWVYILDTPPANTMRLAIYDVNTGLSYPVNLLWESANVPVDMGVSGAWNQIPVEPYVQIVSGEYYYLAIMFENTATVTRFSFGGAAWERPEAPVFPDPFGNSTNATNSVYSLYADGPVSLPTITPTPSVTPSFTTTATFTPTLTQTVTATVSGTITLTSTITPTVTPSPTTGSTLTQTPVPSSTSTSTQTPGGDLTDEVLVYPHPVKGSVAWFYYVTAGPAQVRIELFNVTGERIVVLDQSHATGGSQRCSWTVGATAPGVYFYRVTIRDARGTHKPGVKKLVVIK